MKPSRFLIWLIIFLIFVVFLIDFPTARVKFDIPENSYILVPFKNLGLININKIQNGVYPVDKTLMGPNLEDILGKDFARKFNVKLGLDLQGGTYLALSADMTGVEDNQKDLRLSEVRRIIENRVNGFGIAETNVYTAKNGSDYKVIVELPGSGEQVDRQIETLKQTAKLEFYQKKDTPTDIKSLGLAEGQEIPQQLQFFLNYEPSAVTGTDISDVSIAIDPTTSTTQDTTTNASAQTTTNYQLNLKFTDAGKARFVELAKKNIGKQIPIVLDSQVLIAPTIQNDFTSGFDGNVRVTGQFTKEQAEDYAIQIRGGALPVPVKVVEQRTIEAALGKNALNKSLFAGFVGIVLVILFMIYLYKLEGIIASLALLFYIALTLAIYKYIPITLSLSGIAGFILSIAVAVDANILIFERMNEELRNGKTKKLAFIQGFSQAWNSIRDSNLSTLITCAILFYLGSTVTKGFATNLAIGVGVSLFTAVVVTRQLLILILFRKK